MPNKLSLSVQYPVKRSTTTLKLLLDSVVPDADLFPLHLTSKCFPPLIEKTVERLSYFLSFCVLFQTCLTNFFHKTPTICRKPPFVELPS